MATNKQKCHWRNPIPHHWESLFWRKVIWEAWPHLLLLLLFKKEDGGNKFYSSSFFSPLLNLIIWWWKATVHSDSTHMCVCFFCTVSTLLYKEKTGQCFSTLGVHIKITFSQKKKKYIYIHTHTHTHTHTRVLSQIHLYSSSKYLNVHSMQNIIAGDGDTAVITDKMLALLEFTLQ